MKKPLMLISNDQHLDINNIDTVKGLLFKQIDKAVELGLNEIVLLGDMFDVRASQKLDVMVAFMEILDRAASKDVSVTAIPGNHDKSSYSSHNSWLLPFRSHKALELIEDIEMRAFGDTLVTLMPFFTEEMMVEKIEAAEPSDLFLGHLEMNGSTNHGVVAEGRIISPSMFKKFKKSLFGHYHSPHEVGGNAQHLPSLYQRGYGECEVKGYTLVYDDLSIEHIQSNFKSFKTVKVDIDTLTPKKQKELLKSKESGVNLRIEITGASEKLKSFKKDKFIQAGIDVKIKHDKVFNKESVEMPKINEETIKLSNKKVEELFESFCERDGLDVKKGEKYLHKVLSK